MINAAAFLGNDTTTQGNWVGVYGNDGWKIAAYTGANNVSNSAPGSGAESTANVPPYATTTLSGNDYFVWDTNTGTSSNRKLTRPSGLNPIAACWYTSGSNPWSMTINTTRPCKVSFYLLDWDGGGGRKNTITVKDADTSSILISGLDWLTLSETDWLTLSEADWASTPESGSQTSLVYTGSTYSNGVWAKFSISGNIKFEFLWDGITDNAVVSAVMFDSTHTKYCGGQLMW